MDLAQSSENLSVQRKKLSLEECIRSYCLMKQNNPDTILLNANNASYSCCDYTKYIDYLLKLQDNDKIFSEVI